MGLPTRFPLSTWPWNEKGGPSVQTKSYYVVRQKDGASKEFVIFKVSEESTDMQRSMKRTMAN